MAVYVSSSCTVYYVVSVYVYIAVEVTAAYVGGLASACVETKVAMRGNESVDAVAVSLA